MTNDSKTVRDVCAEIEKIATDIGDMCGADVSFEEMCWSGSRSRLMFEITDRILSAYEREMAAKDAEIKHLTSKANIGARACDEVKELKKRIALLERALKPVMNINLNGLRKYTDIDYGNLLFTVIADAQRIIIEAWDDKNYFWKVENND